MKKSILFFLLAISILARGQTTIMLGENINLNPVLNAGPDLIFVSGQVQAQATVNDATASILWSGPGGFTSTLIQPWLSNLGTYTVQATNIFGCSVTDQLNLLAPNPWDTLWTSTPLPSICLNSGDYIILDDFVSHPGSGTFSGTGVVNRIAYPTVGGTNSVTWTVGNKTLQNTFITNAPPNIYFAQDTVFRCSDESVWLSAVGTAATYSWSTLLDPNTVLSTTYKVMVNNSTQYLLTAGAVYTDKTCYTKDTVTTNTISADFTYVQDTWQAQYGVVYGSNMKFTPDYKEGSSYLWNFTNYYVAGGGTSTEISPTYNYNPWYGYFHVTLEMNSSCGKKTSTRIVRVNYLVETQDDGNKSQGIQVSPNPAVDHVYFDFGGVSVSNIQVFDISGRLVTIKQVNGTTQQIDISAYKSGIYIVKIFDENSGFSNTKFIKQ